MKTNLLLITLIWEGPTGAHHFEGLWKNPSGKVAMTSDFDYQPDQTRFGGGRVEILLR